MARLLDGFYNALQGVGLLGLIACSTPQYTVRGETPLQSLQRIAADVCDKSTVTKDELHCITTRSIGGRFKAECPNGYTIQSNSWGYQSCRREVVVPWDRVRKVIPGSSTVDICLDDRTCLRMERFKDGQQARDFARAIHDYLQ